MKKTTIEKALLGIDYSFPPCVDIHKNVSISLPDQKIHPDSLVFVTERINNAPAKQLSFNEVKPYAIVTDYDYKADDSTIPVIRVKSVRQAFAYACSNTYGIDYDKIKVIGVTGTNGKTTTATIIFKILKYCGYSVGFIGTGKICINDNVITDNTYSMTTPDPTFLYEVLHRMANENCEYAVMEVSSHSLALEKVSPIRFEYGIFTNLNNEHMDFHKTTEEYYKTKLSLFEQVKRGLFNLDDEYSRRAYGDVRCDKASIGIIQPANAYATDIYYKSIKNTSFYYREPNLSFGVKSRLSGAFNVYNIMCALKCVIDLGIKPCIAKKATEMIDSIDGRMHFIRSDITVVIDYAHTPTALYNVLKTINSLDIYEQNITLVFGCGGDRDKSKRFFMGEIASKYANKIIITEDNNRNESFSEIVSDIVKGVSSVDFRIIRDREIAIRAAVREAKSGDIVAIVGKGHEKYKIECGKTIAFDEEAIIKDELTKRSNSGAY